MRIAVLADIHGNLLALEAVLADLDRHKPDLIVDLGDCVSGPLWPRETMDCLSALNALTVRGNHDRQVSTWAPEDMGPSDRFAHGELEPQHLETLGSLPASLRASPDVLAFHASPHRDDLYLLDVAANGRLVRDSTRNIAARLDEPTARIVLCGHSHRPDMLRLDSGILVINPGSVGCPAYEDPSRPAHVSETGTPHARYALVDPRPNGETDVTMIAVAYDHEAAAARAEANGRSEWAFALRTGRMPPA
jgi:predicted phosphodiesterase